MIFLRELDILMLNKKYKNGEIKTDKKVAYTGTKDLNFLGLGTAGKISFLFNKNTTIPNLVEARDIECGSMSSIMIDLPKLQKCEKIDFMYSRGFINLPELVECAYILANKTPKVNLQKLKLANAIYFDNISETLSLPELEDCLKIFANDAEEIHLPKLKECDRIFCNYAKKIIIPEDMVNRISRIPEGCQIIHPEEQKIKESFKSFFYKNIV